LIIISTLYLKILTPSSQFSRIFFNTIHPDLLYFSLNFIFLILLVIILLLIIIAVVKISNRSKGPLRPFKLYVYFSSKTPSYNQNC
jgi:tryptophan-rich sensory protein